MTAADRLVDQLDRAYGGNPWHGSSLEAQLADLGADDAVRRPVPGAHSIFELVLHMAAWKDEVTSRLRGRPAGVPSRGDWPAVPADRAGGWPAALEALDRVHHGLVAAIRELGDSGLDRPTRDDRPGVDRPDTGWEVALGILQHDLYHAGQIGLLKRALQGHDGDRRDRAAGAAGLPARG